MEHLRPSSFLLLLVVLCSGASVAQNARIVLRWKEVPGASAYELQIAKDPAFVEVVLQTRTTTGGYRWEQLPTTMHWWRVRSVDAEGRASEWSLPRTIAVDSAIPTPISPADGQATLCGASVKFELEPSALVTEYMLELANAADFSAARTLRSSAVTFEVSDLKPGPWWWRTRGVDFKGRTSAAGPVRTLVVRVGAPRLKPAADVILGTPQVQLNWSEVGCAQSYLVEATLDGKDKVSFPAAVPTMAFKAGVAGEYRWRVASVDERGTAGEFSAESVFRVRLPVPGGRSESAAGRVELSWSSVPTAVSYKIEIQRANEAVAPITVTSTSWRSSDLAPGPYRWRVTARDSLGHTSAPSDWRSLVRAAGVPLAETTWVTPEADLVVELGSEVELSWAQVKESNAFEVELDGIVYSVPGTSWRSPPLSDGKHLVRVRAVGPGFRQGPWALPREVYAGVPLAARAEVQVQGDLVRVTLFDDHQRPIFGNAPRFQVQRGSVGEPQRVEEQWHLRWSAPLSGADVLVIDDRDFHSEYPLKATEDAQWSIAARAGGIFNAGAVASPTGQLGVTMRLPWLQRRPGVELRLGVYAAHSQLEIPGAIIEGQAWLVPASLLLAWHHRLGNYLLKGGAGPTVQLAWVQVRAKADFRVLPGFEVAVALSRALGPGRLEGDVSFVYSKLEVPSAQLTAGGFAVRVGYAFDLDF